MNVCLCKCVHVCVDVCVCVYAYALCLRAVHALVLICLCFCVDIHVLLFLLRESKQSMVWQSHINSAAATHEKHLVHMLTSIVDTLNKFMSYRTFSEEAERVAVLLLGKGVLSYAKLRE